MGEVILDTPSVDALKGDGWSSGVWPEPSGEPFEVVAIGVDGAWREIAFRTEVDEVAINRGRKGDHGSEGWIGGMKTVKGVVGPGAFLH